MQKHKKPDIVFLATIRTESSVIENVLCRLYLPLKIADELELHFQPDETQSKILCGSRRFSVTGQVKGDDDRILEIIFADEVYSQGSTRKSFGSGLSETILVGIPDELRVTNILHKHPEINKIQVVFWVTPNTFLEPYYQIINSTTGSREIEFNENFEFMPDEQTKFRFERHFHNYKNEDNDDVTFSELVATFEKNDTDNENLKIAAISEKLDNVLLLASFAAMHPCVFLGWESYDSKTVVKQYL